MPAKFKFLFAFLCLALLFGACDRPECKNTNPVFDQYLPDTEEYKAELAKQLGPIARSQLRYWFREYNNTSGQELLYFNIQGEGLCANIVLSVEQWDKLKLLRQKKGISYRGAEFKNLQFDIRQDSLKTEFILNDFTKIID